VSRDYEPEPGQWYEDLDHEDTFRVLSVDPDEALVRIQWLDGEVEDLDVGRVERARSRADGGTRGLGGRGLRTRNEEDLDEEDWDDDETDEDDDWDDDEDDEDYDDGDGRSTTTASEPHDTLRPASRGPAPGLPG